MTSTSEVKRGIKDALEGINGKKLCQITHAFVELYPSEPRLQSMMVTNLDVACFISVHSPLCIVSGVLICKISNSVSLSLPDLPLSIHPFAHSSTYYQNTNLNTHTNTHIHTYIRTYIHTYMHTCTHIHAHTCKTNRFLEIEAWLFHLYIWTGSRKSFKKHF